MDINNKKNICEFKKYIGSCCGNSFVIFDCRKDELSKRSKSNLASKYVPKYGVDSALFMRKSNGMDIYMEIFEKDGSESDSCGNGAILRLDLISSVRYSTLSSNMLDQLRRNRPSC